MTNFRVTLLLHHFFTDQRASSRIYITSQMKTIKAVKEHISALFGVDDFYLSTNDLYLPEGEDIKVLQDGDIITAVPFAGESKRKSCAVKRKHKVADNQKETKLKKAKLANNYCNDKGNVKKKKKKSKEGKKKQANGNCNNIVQQTSKEKDKATILGNKSKTAPPINLKLSLAKPKEIELLKVPTVPKLVKTIHVDDHASKSGKLTEPFRSDTNIQNSDSRSSNSNLEPETLSPLMEVPCTVSFEIENIQLTKKKQELLRNFDVLPNFMHSFNNSKLIKSESNISVLQTVNNDECVTYSLVKPKRQRTRKKKCNNLQNGFEQIIPCSTPEMGTKVPKKDVEDLVSAVETSTNKHIRFDKENQEETKIKKEADNIQTIPIENITSPCNYEKLCREELMKYPVMVNIYPKTFDIIAFKRYILTNEYTPEISDFIVGRVVNFNQENKIVFLKLLVGAEQCAEPDGKFHMETENQEPAQPFKDFLWDSLIEPRLLYP